MYLFDNELFAIECMAKYAMEGLVVDSRNGQFAHCPTPKPKGQKYRLAGDLGYYLTHGDHQHQGLLQSVDFDRRCFYSQDTSLWLDTKPPGYVELYVIYKNYISGEHHPRFGVPHTEETKKKMSETNTGMFAGEKNPCYGRTGENHPMHGRTGALHHNSKAIIVIKPDGTKLHFGSGIEAARDLRIDRGILSIFLTTGKQPKKGKFESWQFFFAEQK